MNSQLLEPFNIASRFRTLGEHLDVDSLNSGIEEGQVCGGMPGSRWGAIIERIGPSRVIQNAQRNTNIDRSYEDATCRARLDNADTVTPLNAYGGQCNEQATTKAAIN